MGEDAANGDEDGGGEHDEVEDQAKAARMDVAREDDDGHEENRGGD